GEVVISMSGVVRSVFITLIVQPPTSTTTTKAHATVNCSPGAIALTETTLANNFAVPAGWPAALTVQVNDDCGNAVKNASVSASFSNGDAPLMLQPTQAGTYANTWQPNNSASQMVITIQAQAAQLKAATAILNGSINANPSAPPVISENGTVNTFN